MQTNFFAITYEYTRAHAAQAVEAAGGVEADEVIDDVIAHSKFRQRVHVKNVATHLADLQNSGYRVVDVEPAVPPIA